MMKNKDKPINPVKFSDGSIMLAHDEYVKQCYPSFLSGLTKREYFAGLAMQGLLTTVTREPDERYAIEAVKMADALLKALEEDDAG